MINWLNDNRKGYAAACLGVAAVSAVCLNLTGFENLLGLDIFLADTMIFGCLLFFAGIALAVIYRYAVPSNYSANYKNLFVGVISLFTGVLLCSVEVLALWLIFPDYSDKIVCSIPTRLFIILLIIIIIRLIYLVLLKEIPAANHSSENVESETDESSVKRLGIADHITVRSGTKIKIIPVGDIRFIKADGDYISIHAAEGSWLKEQTMNSAENMLPMDSFLRVHRSYIVNINSISRIERYGERHQLVLRDGETVKISVARYQLLRKILKL
jgi:preprotein translocase subunit SecG